MEVLVPEAAVGEGKVVRDGFGRRPKKRHAVRQAKQRGERRSVPGAQRRKDVDVAAGRIAAAAGSRRARFDPNRWTRAAAVTPASRATSARVRRERPQRRDGAKGRPEDVVVAGLAGTGAIG